MEGSLLSWSPELLSIMGINNIVCEDLCEDELVHVPCSLYYSVELESKESGGQIMISFSLAVDKKFPLIVASLSQHVSYMPYLQLISIWSS